MSAIEQLPPVTVTDHDRRTTPRLRIREALAVVFGRGDGTLVDISATGARVRHSAPVRLGMHVRLSFEWQQQRFSANGVVLASRVIALGTTGGSATVFESRLRFTAISSDAAELLTHFMESVEARDLNRWIANLRGWEPEEDHAAAEAAYIRCRRRFNRWEQKWTRDDSQPEDGFTVPASIDARELNLLCAMWENSDVDGRDVLRETARASVESSRP
ncbi:MAG TPA: PilZ domain-containing protein [Thermoanaerobaculia bacterium]|nr:PilZ domain-containing protein [Thermoanaerobaculia bacterium]